jgi:hypothetical protein
MSCDYNMYREKEISKEEVIKSIGLLKKAGFFENYKNLSATQTFDSIYELRKREFREILESDIDPTMNLGPIEIAEYDRSKLLFMDLEADVFNGNEVYKSVINRFSELSNGQFQPIEIKEVWESDEGPITVSFSSDNQLTEFVPEYNNDWLHESVFEVCRGKVAEKQVRLVYCLGKDGYGYGQAIAIMRLSKSEQIILEKGLNWKFDVN